MIYRNPDLLALAKLCEFCMSCGKRNEGDVVSAHSNQSRDGKGMGIKAADFRIAFMCAGCHSDLDQGGGMMREARVEVWEAAHRKTIAWMFNACSLLYAAARRAAIAKGYRRGLTYILSSENGGSLEGAGWRYLWTVKGRSWDTPGRPRTDKHPTEDKDAYGWGAWPETAHQQGGGDHGR